jgi:hypothetical protein
VGAFAQATSDVANGVASVARFFGFSRPIVVEKTMLIKHQPFSNGAHVSYFDTSKKLTLDPKQELSVDQSLGAVYEQDCMALKHITSRESFVESFTWDSDDVAMVTNLYSSYVDPLFSSDVALPSGVLRQPAALTFAAFPFNYWRGSITYRFEIVCSKYHRGKLLFKFEPNIAQKDLIDSDQTKLNQQDTIIVDIQELTEISITVPFVSDRAWLQVHEDPSDPYLGISPGFHYETSTGFLTVRPLNELVQPTSTSSVRVNVFVSSMDLELSCPNNLAIKTNLTYTETESGALSTNILQQQTSNDNIYKHHFGEKVESFRALLKRYCTTHSIERTIGSSGYKTLVLNHGIYPSIFNYADSSNIARDPAAIPSLFEYLRYGYLGMRGGYRWRYRPTSNTNLGDQAWIVTTLTTSADSNPAPESLNETNTNTAANRDPLFAKLDGSVVHNLNLQGGAECEYPYFSNDLFRFTSAFGVLGIHTHSDKTPNVKFTMSGRYTSADIVSIEMDTASAEDFTFLRFQGAPFVVN